MLLSDLDLDEIADDPRLIKPAVRKRDRARSADQTVAENAPRHTIDFFKAFPETFGTLSLQTAARMSSAFPFISPAVDLPTKPARRVVDAGYFDNYGMTTALIYLRRPEVIRWMRENGMKGAILIQINAFPTLGEYEPKPGSEQKKGGCYASDPVEWRFLEWLSTPSEGLVASRERSMVYRSEQALAALQDIYKAERLDLARVPFENTAQSSFSWYLPGRELDCMRAELKLEHNAEQFRRLDRLWSDKAPWSASSAAGAVPQDSEE